MHVRFSATSSPPISRLYPRDAATRRPVTQQTSARTSGSTAGEATTLSSAGATVYTTSFDSTSARTSASAAESAGSPLGGTHALGPHATPRVSASLDAVARYAALPPSAPRAGSASDRRRANLAALEIAGPGLMLVQAQRDASNSLSEPRSIVLASSGDSGLYDYERSAAAFAVVDPDASPQQHIRSALDPPLRMPPVQVRPLCVCSVVVFKTPSPCMQVDRRAGHTPYHGAVVVVPNCRSRADPVAMHAYPRAGHTVP